MAKVRDRDVASNRDGGFDRALLAWIASGAIVIAATNDDADLRKLGTQGPRDLREIAGVECARAG